MRIDVIHRIFHSVHGHYCNLFSNLHKTKCCFYTNHFLNQFNGDERILKRSGYFDYYFHSNDNVNKNLFVNEIPIDKVHRTHIKYLIK